MKKNNLETVLDRCFVTSNNCWLWRKQLHNGYGYVSWAGRRRRVHRLVYELLVGKVQQNLPLDHLCRNRACCNPEHLEPVTNSENLRRSPLVRLNNGNAIKTHCRYGHEYNEANTYYRPDGGRTCRSCNRDSAARSQQVRLDRMIDPT